MPARRPMLWQTVSEFYILVQGPAMLPDPSPGEAAYWRLTYVLGQECASLAP
jgi:hypothetical protein